MRNPCLFFYLLLFAYLLEITLCKSSEPPQNSESVFKQEIFQEELLIRPLPDGKHLLVHFSFTNKLKEHSNHHLHIFPKSIDQLVRHTEIREAELSFTQGRWDQSRWGSGDGISTANGKAPGVELWAWLGNSTAQVDSAWVILTNALSGIFCASLQLLSSKPDNIAPANHFRPDLLENDAKNRTKKSTAAQEREHAILDGPVRYGFLPREAFCTENLTPWIKILPCSDKAGLAKLLDRNVIYGSQYHSLRVLIKAEKGRYPGAPRPIILQQTLTFVVKTDGEHFSHWKISSTFRKPISEACILADESFVFVEVDKKLVGSEAGPTSEKKIFESEYFKVSPAPGAVYSLENSECESSKSTAMDKMCVATFESAGKVSVLLAYSVKELAKGLKSTEKERKARKLPELEFSWNKEVQWQPLVAPYHVERYLTGYGNERGGIAIQLTSTNSEAAGNVVAVDMFQVIPWFVRVYLSTLRVFLNGKEVSVASVARKSYLVPAEDRAHSTQLEISFEFPGNVSMIEMHMEFEKAFLYVNEHPPDASRGLDIPPAIFTFSCLQSIVKSSVLNDGMFPTTGNSPLLSQLENAEARVYTNSLEFPLPLPDFSMPYNVITFTSTVLAMFVGMLLNVLRRRSGDIVLEAKKECQDKAKLPHSERAKLYMLLASPKAIKLVILVAIGVVILNNLEY